jgi:hypothetical protein
MDRDTKIVAYASLISSLGGWGFVFYLANVAFRAHALGRPTMTEVVVLALACAVVMLIVSAYGSWIAYLIFFRFLTNLVRSGDVYMLETTGRHVVHATQLTLARKLGESELALILADKKHWVCRWDRIAALNDSDSGSFPASNLKV